MQDTDQSPAERRRLRVRGAILEAAERVFALEGADGLSIRRIADEIDYSPAAIYKYFGSKEELLNELKEAFFGRILESVNTIVDRSEPFAKRARKCTAGYIRTALEKPHHYVAAFAGVAPEMPMSGDLAGFSESNRARAFGILTDLVEEGLESGHFRADLPLLETAKSIWASMHGLAMMIAHFNDFPSMATMPSEMSQDQFIDFHADLVVRSLEAGTEGAR
ncbi:TetR/AcrR family transcriptional regulator [Henriciella sp.]|uniref:TetR/AcrR family transcriptional regulator n=1 Tax=Henriciella sp. TaxID=1968823 RepID=UPI002605E93A|nr:TetR/AcrR family transcriptional regulator [Henriciella sp.]